MKKLIVFLIVAGIVFCVVLKVFNAGKTSQEKSNILEPDLDEKIKELGRKKVNAKIKTIRAQPNNLLLRCKLGRSAAITYFSILGDYKEAIKWFGDSYKCFKKLTPQQKAKLPYAPQGLVDTFEVNPLTMIGYCYYALGDKDKAVKIWKRVLREYPDRNSICRELVVWSKEDPQRVYNCIRSLFIHNP